LRVSLLELRSTVGFLICVIFFKNVARRFSCSAVLVWRSLYYVGLFSAYLRCSLRIYPFGSCTLFQRSMLLGLFTRPALDCLAAVSCASLEVLYPSVLAVSGACISQACPCLALSALALSRRFSGFRSLWPFEFISPRSAPGFLLQSFLLQEIGCFFLRDFVAFRSSFRLLSLAATRSCYRVSRLNPVLSTTLQFDFRGFFPLTARSIGSGVSRLQWPMLSWFSILFRGFVSLCCALPTLISVGVAPLLRRRLYGLQ